MLQAKARVEQERKVREQRKHETDDSKGMCIPGLMKLPSVSLLFRVNTVPTVLWWRLEGG